MRVILSILVICQMLLAQGEMVQICAQYDPGTRVYFPSQGISFIIPREWKGGLAAANETFVMTSDTKAGIGLAIFKSSYNQPDLEKYLNSVQNLGDNIVLQPVGKVEYKASELSQKYSSSIYRGYAIAKIGPFDRSIICFFAGPSTQEKDIQSISEKISQTVTFNKPDPGLIVKDWQNRLTGMMLQKIVLPEDDHPDSPSVKTHLEQIHFCSDGSYRSHAKSQGKWRIEVHGLKPQLILLNTGQESLTYTLGITREKVSLSGVYYTIQKSQECK